MKHSLKIIFILVCTFSLISKLKAQNFNLVKSIPTEANKILADRFNILYIVEQYKISSFNTQGDFLYSYENMDEGEISQFDVSNPLKPIAFSEDYNTVNILDNKLSLINSINLFDLNLNQISAISIPNTMQFWVYDQIETRLKLYDKNFNLLNQSENFIQLFNEVTDVENIKIANAKVYLLDKNGIKVFDQFGTFIKQYNIEGILDFQVINQQIVFFKENKLISINELSLIEQTLVLENTSESIINAVLLKDHVFIQTEKTCYIYSIH